MNQIAIRQHNDNARESTSDLIDWLNLQIRTNENRIRVLEKSGIETEKINELKQLNILKKERIMFLGGN